MLVSVPFRGNRFLNPVPGKRLFKPAPRVVCVAKMLWAKNAQVISYKHPKKQVNKPCVAKFTLLLHIIILSA